MALDFPPDSDALALKIRIKGSLGGCRAFRRQVIFIHGTDNPGFHPLNFFNVPYHQERLVGIIYPPENNGY